MQNRKGKQTTFEKSLKQAIILSCVFTTAILIILGLYKAMDTVIERFFVLIIGVMFLFPLIPITISFMMNFIISCGKHPEKDFESKKVSVGVKSIKPTSKSNTEPNKHKLKIVTTEGYEEFNNILKASMKSKLMSRECILKLKSELIYKLGTHIEVYKDFKFENDLHCIYTLSKSSVLTKDDYIYLAQFISNNLNFPDVG
ncbi:hypothetical protein [Clostridium beijerinckii]|uniref:hypothetical protein n=1 Tax=Clostridium beijerinckii TaxID=1520 RepID=UPI00156D57F3|nr:hypothetical protein [Clostridium beijerinckii]NRU52522.1 hypothetical protein [Clostridium beijerinckii]NYC69401.1 hypothetical protein [Clostridium beijerinckii]NYC91723.1 hypothetical protein [Clostridium beijerinckii]